MSDLFLGGWGGGGFLSVCWRVNMKISIFSIFMLIVHVTPLHRPLGNERNETFAGSKGFSHEEKLDILFWLDYTRSRVLHSSTSNPAAMKPRVSCKC